MPSCSPFLIGIVELQVNRLDKEFAELLESYGPYLMKTVGGYPPALSRVLPVNIKAKVQQEVHRYEDVVRVVEKAKSFQLLECMCRKEARLMGRGCDHTLEACLGISNYEGAFDKFPLGKIISREQTLEVLAQSEDEGLVHTTYNVQRGQMFICNCCPCCCGILRSMKDFHVPHVLAKSNFTAVIDSATCESCGVCANERCPMDAIVPDNGAYRVEPERCIGCGACTPTCPPEAIRLVPKPPAQRDDPPDNILEWAFKRAANRGIQISID